MKFIVSTLAALCLTSAAFAHDYAQAGLSIAHPFIPTPAATAKAAGGYMTITNSTEAADYLVGVETEAARRAEVHTTETGADGVTKMMHLEKVEIPAGATVALERGGVHVMLMGLTAPLTEGARVPAVLVFEKAGRVAIEFAIDAPAKHDAKAAEDHSGH